MVVGSPWVNFALAYSYLGYIQHIPLFHSRPIHPALISPALAIATRILPMLHGKEVPELHHFLLSLVDICKLIYHLRHTRNKERRKGSQVEKEKIESVKRFLFRVFCCCSVPYSQTFWLQVFCHLLINSSSASLSASISSGTMGRQVPEW